MVVNAMIATTVAHAKQTSENIYHVGSSVSNPIKFNSIYKCGYVYFTQNPWIDNDGKRVRVKEFTVLKTMASFHTYINLHYSLPLKILKVVNIILCQAFAQTYNNLERQINLVLRLVKLYEPYLFSSSL